VSNNSSLVVNPERVPSEHESFEDDGERIWGKNLPSSDQGKSHALLISNQFFAWILPLKDEELTWCEGNLGKARGLHLNILVEKAVEFKLVRLLVDRSKERPNGNASEARLELHHAPTRQHRLVLVVPSNLVVHH